MSEFSSLEGFKLILNAFLKYVCSVQNKATEFKRNWLLKFNGLSNLKINPHYGAFLPYIFMRFTLKYNN